MSPSGDEISNADINEDLERNIPVFRDDEEISYRRRVVPDDTLVGRVANGSQIALSSSDDTNQGDHTEKALHDRRSDSVAPPAQISHSQPSCSSSDMPSRSQPTPCRKTPSSRAQQRAASLNPQAQNAAAASSNPSTRRRIHEPRWTDDDDNAVQHAETTIATGQHGKDSSSNATDHSDSEPEVGKPEVGKPEVDESVCYSKVTAITLTAGHRVNIRSQSRHLQSVLYAAMDMTYEWLCFDDAFPDVAWFQHEYMRTILYECALKVGEPAIAHRIFYDNSYAVLLAEVPEARIYLFRRDIKQACTQHLLSLYGLTGALFSSYLETVLQCLFQETPECNSQTVSLVYCTHRGWQVFCCLKEHETGFENTVDFSQDSFEETYKTHLGILEVLEQENPSSYHHLMATIFDSASTGHASTVQEKVRDTVSFIRFNDLE
ncbi:hypothetical protein WOLCODRAFT_17368 [Wolfiporia cocos MD-104 SS10]|uniref:DUF6532 domain-containing protein n=1 Tax=Wolfiporia cocos (strain MD-104) TaxID=742152 RepID=A0A2H3JVM5_WOLCO|nr:hypothetical protein WOLCODRAFT_17368 [Wolfiporia cocos MD-104 SS10]